MRPKAPAPMTATRRGGIGLLLGGGVEVGGGLYSGATAGVEVEDLRDLVFGFGGRGKAEAGGCGGGFAAEVRVGGDELEQVKSDVFRAASGVAGAGFHRCLSSAVPGTMVAKGRK